MSVHQTDQYTNHIPPRPPQIDRLTTHKSYGVWDGVRKDPGGTWESGRWFALGDLKGARSLGGVREFRSGVWVLKGVWGLKRGSGDLRGGLGIWEGLGVREGSGEGV